MILVTGGAGFIGSNIVEHLVGLGRPVRVLDDFSTGSRENLARLASEIDLIEGDLRDRRTLARALQGIRHVLHQGALPSVPLSIEKPLLTHACNVEGTLNLLQAAREAGVRRLVFASSSSVYGDT
ncbi:MAG: NAD-dependent epimerase/dehydratase family protein, partial [Deltaproteobacteria bacterium]